MLRSFPKVPLKIALEFPHLGSVGTVIIIHLWSAPNKPLHSTNSDCIINVVQYQYTVPFHQYNTIWQYLIGIVSKLTNFSHDFLSIMYKYCILTRALYTLTMQCMHYNGAHIAGKVVYSWFQSERSWRIKVYSVL